MNEWILNDKNSDYIEWLNKWMNKWMNKWINSQSVSYVWLID